MTHPTKAEMTNEEAAKVLQATLLDPDADKYPQIKTAITIAIAALSKPKVTDEMVERAGKGLYAWAFDQKVADRRWPHSVFADGYRKQARAALTAALETPDAP